jgi:Ca2+-binding RTX toxin-like protein
VRYGLESKTQIADGPDSAARRQRDSADKWKDGSMAWRFGTDDGDTLYGTAEADSMKGYGGDDVLKGGGGADTLNGGAGIDTAMYSDSTVGVDVDLMTGRGRFGTAEGDTLAGIENIFGSVYDDVLTGNDVSNTLTGSNGNDQLNGHGGTDLLDGGHGNDFLTGGTGNDTLRGGDGFDAARYFYAPAGVIVSLIDGTATGGDGNDTLTGIETVYGSQHNDVLLGNHLENYLHGWLGADTIYGGAASDGLEGHNGDDLLYGEGGNDSLGGGDGFDRIIGGMERDYMTGGAGPDTFIWEDIGETGGTSIGSGDMIYDFSNAEGDQINLQVIDADAYAPGNQGFRFIGAADFSGTPGEINYVHDQGNTFIQMQTGISADVEGVIAIVGIVTPEASWFVL